MHKYIILERLFDLLTGLFFGIILGMLFAQPTIPEVQEDTGNCITDYVEGTKRLTCVER